LPGGFVDQDEATEAACRREVMEETRVKIGRLRLVGVYSAPGRDPRGPTCSVAYVARVRPAKASAGSDASSVEWVSNWRRRELAFDHRKIITDAIQLMKTSERSKRPDHYSKRL
jgi:8-oxo-dGTP diphosphatase